MTKKQCKEETKIHIERVQYFLNKIAYALIRRAMEHDKSKLESPELEVFTKYTPKLANSTYGSKKYKKFLSGMKKALKHHYQNNRHHPEHFGDGMKEMNIIDFVEMCCDWKAATYRHKDGDFRVSIIKNQERFKYSDDLKEILLQTAYYFMNGED